MHSQDKTSQDYLSELLNVPEKMMIDSVIAMGYPDEEKPPHKKEELQYEKVYLNAYGHVFW